MGDSNCSMFQRCATYEMIADSLASSLMDALLAGIGFVSSQTDLSALV